MNAVLGLGDFHLQSFEAIQKWFQVVLLALNYLQLQQALAVVKTGKLHILADFIRIHRQEHAYSLLRSVAERVLACGQIEPVLQFFIRVEQGVTQNADGAVGLLTPVSQLKSTPGLILLFKSGSVSTWTDVQFRDLDLRFFKVLIAIFGETTGLNLIESQLLTAIGHRRHKMVKTEEKVAVLADVPLFRELNNHQLKQIASRFITRTYQPDQEIITQGKTGFGMFMIISGHAEAIVELSDGSKTVVNDFTPTDFFGEVTMLDGGPRTASVVAREKTECLVLGRIEFISLMHDDAEIATEIAVALAKRLRRTMGMI